jgi:hypothetical protein
MFKLTPKPTFEVPVQLTVPGQPEPETVRIVFNHKTAEGIATWYAKHVEATAKEGLLEVIVSWSGVVDEEGREVPFSGEALDRLLHGYSTAAAEIMRAYVRGLTESRVKN